MPGTVLLPGFDRQKSGGQPSGHLHDLQVWLRHQSRWINRLPASLRVRSSCKNAAKRKGVVKLTAFVDSRPENREELRAVRASALLGLFIVETNQSISSADTLAKLAPHMFPDSNIAAKMTSGLSKTTAVIKVNYFVICFNLMHFCLTEAIENVSWNLYDFDINKNCCVHWD